MSVLGSQLEIDMDPEGEAAVIPRHVGNTGTGCYKLHDHRISETKKKKDGPKLAAGHTLIFGKNMEPETAFGCESGQGSQQGKPGKPKQQPNGRPKSAAMDSEGQQSSSQPKTPSLAAAALVAAASSMRPHSGHHEPMIPFDSPSHSSLVSKFNLFLKKMNYIIHGHRGGG